MKNLKQHDIENTLYQEQEQLIELETPTPAADKEFEIIGAVYIPNLLKEFEQDETPVDKRIIH